MPLHRLRRVGGAPRGREVHSDQLPRGIVNGGSEGLGRVELTDHGGEGEGAKVVRARRRGYLSALVLLLINDSIEPKQPKRPKRPKQS